jgi:nucleoside-diphosphate-sugar epimerase
MNTLNKKPKVLVTGANGYIGENLLQKLTNDGYEVVALVRNPETFQEREGIVVYPYQLDGDVCQDFFYGVSAIIHLATFTGKRNAETQKIELNAIKHLLVAAKTGNVEKVVFVSSQSAQVDSPTFYGRDKWLLEQEVKKHDVIIVRPGLVYGGNKECALFGMLCKLVNNFSVVPNLIPAPVVQPVHVDDLCQALLNILITKTDRFEYNIASDESLRFIDFLKALAWYRYNKYIWSFPFPSIFLNLFSLFLKLIPFVNLNERIDGLLALKKIDTQQSLNLTLRPLAEGLTKKPNLNRQLLIEGNALMRYVSGKFPKKLEVRRYAHMIKRLRSDKPMAIRYLFLKFPSLLRWFDPKWPIMPLDENEKSELKWRMNAALVICEATPNSSLQFTLFSSKQIVSSVLSLGKQILIEPPLFFIMVLYKILFRIGLINRFKVTQ